MRRGRLRRGVGFVDAVPARCSAATSAWPPAMSAGGRLFRIGAHRDAHRFLRGQRPRAVGRSDLQGERVIAGGKRLVQDHAPFALQIGLGLGHLRAAALHTDLPARRGAARDHAFAARLDDHHVEARHRGRLGRRRQRAGRTRPAAWLSARREQWRRRRARPARVAPPASATGPWLGGSRRERAPARVDIKSQPRAGQREPPMAAMIAMNLLPIIPSSLAGAFAPSAKA